MARPAPPAEMEFPGSDSFLDVVTNIVGILIILVVAIGVRSRQAGIANSNAAAEPQSAPAQTSGLHSDLANARQQVQLLENEIAARAIERAQLATFLVAADHQLADRRERLGTMAQRQYDLNHEVRLAQATLDQLSVHRSAVEATTAPAVKIESYPTPLSRTVQGKEMHFQLKQGRVVYIPLDDLLERFKSTAREKVWKLKDQAEIVETVGPVEGFRLRYTLERLDIPLETAMETRRGGSVIQLSKWELLPVTSHMGETRDEALARDSQFQARLASAHRHRYTITLWTYPDSFDLFRSLRKVLYEMDYPVAGRPLPDGIPIGGSPRGSKSAAE